MEQKNKKMAMEMLADTKEIKKNMEVTTVLIRVY